MAQTEDIYSINVGSKNIAFTIRFAERKTLTISVYPNKEVGVIAPFDASLEKIKEKVKKRVGWIISQQNYFESFEPVTPERKYISGETHLYLGRQYRLKILENEEQKITLQNGYIYIQTKDKSDKLNIKRQLDNWYRERAELKFPIIFEQMTLKIKKFNVRSKSYEIRNMPKRWGSCTPQGKILLNPEIIKAPKACIEYVMVHELCHLKHHDHSRAFYNLQTLIMPDWQKWKDRLEKIMV